jgi:sulfite exporter TauE/SafE
VRRHRRRTDPGPSSGAEASAVARLPYLLAYNGGRIISYMVAGALAGGVGAWATHLLPVHRAQLGLQLLAGLFMILLGLYLAGWQTVLGRLERAGGVLWRRIEPLGRRWLPVRTPAQALRHRPGVGLAALRLGLQRLGLGDRRGRGDCKARCCY